MNPFEIRLAWRSVAREPLVSGAILLTVALAIAANTALFSIFDGLFLRPLPFNDSERIFHLNLPFERLFRRTDWAQEALRLQAVLRESDFITTRARAHRISAFDEGSVALDIWHVRPVAVSPQFFPLLGVRPFLGREFSDSDISAKPRSVVLGFDLWQTRFGADETIIDRLIDIPGSAERWRVVGVMPKGFHFPSGASFWVAAPETMGHDIPTFVKLARSSDVERLRLLAPELRIVPLRNYARPDGAIGIGVLLGATSLLLLLAWVQVSALSLARFSQRSAEFGTRLALGSSLGALRRQAVIECLMLLSIALGLAWLATPAIIALIVFVLPPETTIGQTISADLRTFVFACGLSGIGFVGLSIFPVLITSTASPTDLLRGTGWNDGTLRARQLLSIAQVTLATALMYVSGLALHSFLMVSAVDPGFRPQGAVAIFKPNEVIPHNTPREQVRAAETRFQAVTERVMHRMSAHPAVHNVSTGLGWPLRVGTFAPVALRPEADPTTVIEGRTSLVGKGYVDAIGLRLLEGREPTEQETAAIGLDVIGIVTASLANRLRAHGPVLGQSIFVAPASRLRITGIVEDFRTEGLHIAPVPTVLIYYKHETMGRALIVRAARVDDRVIGDLLAIARDEWGDRASQTAIKLDDVARTAAVQFRARALVLSMASVLCLPIAVIGIGTMLNFTVRLRQRRTAIHIALGADPGTVGRTVIAHAVSWSAAGLILGLTAGTAAGQLMSAYLFNVTPYDSRTAAVVAGLVLSTTVVAAVAPARRAAATDPAEVLRAV